MRIVCFSHLRWNFVFQRPQHLKPLFAREFQVIFYNLELASDEDASKFLANPYYPIPRAENEALFKRYEALALGSPEVLFVGRLATYRYYNMDQVVGQALATYRRHAAQLLRVEDMSSATAIAAE